MVIYDIREVLRTSVEKKLKADITDAGTMLDGTGADFAFKLKGRRVKCFPNKSKQICCKV